MRYRLVGVALSLLLVSGLVTTIPGCNGKTGQIIEDNKPLIIATIKLAAKKGTELGLKKWAEKQPDAAKEAADALSRNLKDEILPYLEGAELKTSTEINEFIDSSLFKNVPDEIKYAITAAAEVLDLYLPIPGADNLKPDQLEYLKAFLVGVQTGAANFLGNSSSERKMRYWITGEQKTAQLERHWIR